MPRIATAIVLALCTLWSGAAALFAWGGFLKGGFDLVMLGAAGVFVLSLGLGWWAFSRRRHVLALGVAAAPVALSVIGLSTMQLRLF